ncbi:NEDD8-activating enzyme E1 catalytic subunit-like isoform X2 [Ischnura elegans]|uniref:NEDD8-activating enzyme E1 catalytic subunit-like isoform X2 n=1 Tax=Ischnura elegans TaxID=197161 RepID=UPI001ED86DD4|nr:NEDD8-activating enzyme E1 catalytic subunit-like isoform X2 [Ischnura elegans]
MEMLVVKYFDTSDMVGGITGINRAEIESGVDARGMCLARCCVNHIMEFGAGDGSSYSSRWQNIRKILRRVGPFCHPDFDAASNTYEFLRKVKVLVIGAGGLGCEILKNLALMGFGNLHIIDMDTIDLSNLNRQFLFRLKDVGRPKAEVASEFIMKRVAGCSVKPYYNKIQDFDQEFYQSFNLVICGLDSIAARRWVNGMLISVLSCDGMDNEIDVSSVIPFVDGGTEGFKGNCRVILPGLTPCIDCTIDLYPPQTTYPLCTLANTPRLPEHCVEYVKLVLWPKENPWDKNVALDGDDPMHVSWVYEKSVERALQYGITGLNYRLVQGIVKNIIPAVASTNAVIAAACTSEAFKIVTNCCIPLSNQMIYNDVDGIYCYSYSMDLKEDCVSCSSHPKEVEVKPNITLSDLIKYLCEYPSYQFLSPAVMANVGGKTKTLYMPNVPSIEAATRGNLKKTLSELGLTHGSEIAVADKTSPNTVTFSLRYAGK